MAEEQKQIDETKSEDIAAAKADPEQDEELSALLNSALDDFDKPPPTSKEADKLVENTDGSDVTSTDNLDGLLDGQWTDEFIKQAAAQFEQNFQAFLTQSGTAEGRISPDHLGTNFQKIAEAASRVMTDEAAGTDGEFAAAISQTLRSLSEGAENLQNQFSDEEIANMFSNLNMGDADGDGGGDFLPFLQQMLQSLLSKEILYPALRDIVDKYPNWLEENKSKLEESEYERFNKQKTLMEQVCAELDNESEADTPDTKKQRFDIILDLMQKMQDCGQPPRELFGGDLGSIVTFDDEGNPRLPAGFAPGADPSQCSLM